MRLWGYEDRDTWRKGLWGWDPDLKGHKAVSGPVEDTDKELAVTAGVQGHY